jgi:hypothetical protein
MNKKVIICESINTYRNRKTDKISIFQACLPHYTSVHKDDLERITIAFDLSIKQRTLNYIKLY